MVENIVSTAGEVVHDSVGVDTDTQTAASVDHAFEVITSAHAAFQSVGDGLVHEPPGVQLTILGPLVCENGLLSGVDLDAHPATSSQLLALLLDILVRPAEHLNDTALLTILIFGTLIDGRVLP